MLVFAHESVNDIWDEAMVLAHAQWEENEAYRHGQGFNPDRKRYEHYEKIGFYYHFTGRDNGRMVASAGLYITPSMHTQRMIATEDTFYVVPEYRRGWNGIHLVEFAEKFLRSKGVEEFMLTTPISNEKSEGIVRFLGFKQVSKGWSKDLTEVSHVRSVRTSRA